MKLSAMLASLFNILFLTSIAKADFAADKWRYYKHIAPPDKIGFEYGLVKLDAETFSDAAADLADIRVVNASGGESPYELIRHAGTTETVSCASRMIDLGQKGNTTSFILDLLERGAIHNRITLRTASVNFRATVTIESSVNRIDWKTIKKDAVVFDVTAGYKASHLAATYPDSTAAHIRVNIHSQAEPLEITGADVAKTITTAPERELRQFEITKTGTNDKISFWELDFGRQNIPVSHISVFAQDRNFQRNVSVFIPSNEPDKWTNVGCGVIWRFSTDKYKGSNTTVAIPEIKAAKLRVEISNYDNPPLNGVGLKIYGVKYELLFPGSSAPFKLYYGNPAAKAPNYDFHNASKYVDKTRVDRYALGQQSLNRNYIPPADMRPWTERYPKAFWAAIILTCLILCWLIWKKTIEVSANER